MEQEARNYGETAALSGKAIRQSEQGRSLHSAIETASGVHKRLDETSMVFAKLADHATAIATRLSGPYPDEVPKDPRSASGAERPPQSQVDAINSTLRDLFPKIDGLDPSLARLGRALDVIERALG